MRKVLLPIVAAFIVAAFYIVSGPGGRLTENEEHMGDLNSIGTEEDADARINYELMRLKNPATGKIPYHIRERELEFASNLPSDRYLVSAKTTALDWDPRGPWNVGGRTRALAIDVSNENNILAGTIAGGMWRSTDKGQTWHPTKSPNEYKSVSCIVQDTRPGHTNIWYYGAGEAIGASASDNGAYYFGDGIYKSVDSGKTWNKIASTASQLTSFDHWSDIVWNIAIDPSDMVNNKIYVAAYGAIYRSIDSGHTWTSVLGTLGTAQYSDVAVTRTGVVYATLSSDGPNGGIYRSADGISFTKITPSWFPAPMNRYKIGISPADENQVYFLGNTPGYGYPDTNYVGTIEWNSLWKYWYRSGNGAGDTGGKWQDRSLNLPSTGGPFDKFMTQGSYDMVIKVKPNDTNVVFVGGTNLYRSTSGFADKYHTTYIGGYKEHATLPVVDMYLNHHPDQHEVVFFPSNPNKMLSGNDGGIFYTNDNTAPSMLWTSLNNGYLTSLFYTCAIDHAATNDVIVGGAQDNGSWFTNSQNLTQPWVSPRGGDGSYCAIADNGTSYYFSIQLGRIMKAKLTPSGRVDSFARIDPIGGRGYQFINPFALDPNNNNIMYLAAGRLLWRNNDLSGIPFASNWDSISTNWFKIPDSISTGGGNITAVAVSKKPANRVYIGTDSHRVLRIDSANVGIPRFRNITSSIFPTSGNVSCVAVDPVNADNIIVTYSNYGVYSLFYSHDGGTTFSKIAGNLEDNKTTGAGNGPSIRWASIIPVYDGSPSMNGRVYLVGTSVGLFATTQLNDTNTVWVQQGTNTIGASVVDMIDYRTTDGLVVVATHSGGIFSSHITQTGSFTSVPSAPVAANNFTFTNYPNPFTGETTIQFNLPESSYVSLVIYDGMGRLVRTVANEQMPAGDHKYLFATNNLAPGIYYCNIKAGGRYETRKIEILR